MFDKLLLSTKDQRKGRTGKFLFVTSLCYSLALASALVVSVFAASPQLYESSDKLSALPAIPLAVLPPSDTPARVDPARPQSSATPNLENVQNFERVSRNTSTNQPPITNLPSLNPIGDFVPGGGGTRPGVIDGDGRGGDIGLPTGREIELPPLPPVTKPVEKPQPLVERQMIRVPSKVLTGNAIERRTPTYPILAKQARIEGSVVVEIVVSPDGRVESARPLGGHPLLITAAVDAARGWRFQPTLLNGVAVRVTGVITFNFKLN